MRLRLTGASRITSRLLLLAALGLGSTAASCPHLTINPEVQNFGAEAQSSRTIAVTSNVEWTAVSSQSFVSISSGSGKNSGTVTYNVAQNTGAARAAEITISGGGKSAGLAIFQDAATTPVLTLSVSSQSVGAGGQNGLTTTVTSNGAWTAVSNQGFVSIASGSSGSGNATITYNVVANTGAARSAEITVTRGQLTATLTVSQAGAVAVDPLIQVSPTSQNNVAVGGQNGLTASVTANVAWSAVSNQTFVTFAPGGSAGSGNGTITYNVGANPAGARSATITISGGAAVPATLTINQNGVGPFILANTTTFNVGSGAQNAMTTNISSNVAWSASSNAGFVTFNSGGTGTNDGVLSFNVTANSGAARSATITISGGSATPATVTVNQAAAPSIALNPTTANVGAAGQNNLSTSVTANVSWSAASNQGFVTFNGGGAGTNNGTVSYNVAANTGAARSATVTVSGGGAAPATLMVNQDAAADSLSFTSSAVAVPVSGQTNLTINVNSNVSWTATPTTFLSIGSGATGSGNGTITYNVTGNNTLADRSATITATKNGGGVSAVFTVNQNKGHFLVTDQPPNPLAEGSCRVIASDNGSTAKLNCSFDASPSGNSASIASYTFRLQPTGNNILIGSGTGSSLVLPPTNIGSCGFATGATPETVRLTIVTTAGLTITVDRLITFVKAGAC